MAAMALENLATLVCSRRYAGHGTKLNQFYLEIKKDLLNMEKGCLVALEPTEILLKKVGV